MKITSINSSFEQLCIAYQCASVNSLAVVSLNTSNQDHHENKRIWMTPAWCFLMYWMVS